MSEPPKLMITENALNQMRIILQKKNPGKTYTSDEIVELLAGSIIKKPKEVVKDDGNSSRCSK